MLLIHALARVRSGALREVPPASRALRPITLLAATLVTGATLLLSAAADAAPPSGGPGYGRPGGGAPPGGAYGRAPGGPPSGAWGRPPGGPPPGAWGRPPGGSPPGAWGRPPGAQWRAPPPVFHPRPWGPAPRVGVVVAPGWGWGGWGWGAPGWGWSSWGWGAPGWGGWGWGGWGWPGWSGPPVVVAPAPVVVSSNPPIFVERGDVAPSAQSGTLEPGYWYYCHGPAGYYPNVADCPGGWERVAPLPQSPQ